MEFRSSSELSLDVPDDRTLVQFMLDDSHRTRVKPTPGKPTPWFIEDATGRPMFFDEVRSRVHGLANGLHLKHGIRDNDVVLIFSPNVMDYGIAVWALHRLGAIFTGANPVYTAEELIYQGQVSKAKLFITHPDMYSTALSAATSLGLPPSRVITFGRPPSTGIESVEETIELGSSQPTAFVEPRLKPGEGKTKTAMLFFSSGTTGRPKAVVISHFSPIVNIIQVTCQTGLIASEVNPEFKKVDPGDVSVGVLPFYHIFGFITSLHLSIYVGLSVVIIQKFHFESFLQSVVRHKITFLGVAPPTLVSLVKHPATKKYDLSHVRMVLFGAAPVSQETQKQLIDLLPQAEICQGYGMTETATVVSIDFAKDKTHNVGSAGQLVPGCKARVVKSDGSLAGYGEEGELWVWCPSNASRYLDNEEATKETFKDGWVRTGDIVVFKSTGDLYILDRAKELIKVRGFQVAPAELEGSLLDHPLVADACVVGVPDEYNGELPMAFVVPAFGKDPRGDPAREQQARQELMNHIAERKASFKRLAAGVVFVDSIPKNPSGKLLRRHLKDTAHNIWKKRKTSVTSAKL